GARGTRPRRPGQSRLRPRRRRLPQPGAPTAAAAGRRSDARSGRPRGSAREAAAEAPASRRRTRATTPPRRGTRAPRGSARSARGAPRTRGARPRRARRARTRPSGRGGPRFPFPLSRLGLREQVAQPAKAAEHPGFDRTDRLSEPLRELGLREAAVVRELEGLALLIRKLPQRELHAL